MPTMDYRMGAGFLSCFIFVVYLSAVAEGGQDIKDFVQKRPACKAKYFKQKLDHFSFRKEQVFKQRYVVCPEEWQEGGPILFYTGNEGDIMLFVNNTGFMFEMAKELSAMVLFAEHRYYGRSIPFDGKTLDATTLPWLTSTQALADYNDLIISLKSIINGAKNSPVIAVGGSYGGMLAAWMRMKYPATIVGALSSSAPILQFGDALPCNTFAQIATRDYQQASQTCVDTIKRSWGIIADLWKTKDGRDWLKDTFHICNALDNDKIKLEDFRVWLFAGWTYMAMTDYPYPTTFLKPLPGWPVKEACKFLNDASHFQTDRALLKGIFKGISVYYNYSGAVKTCFNLSESSTGSALGEIQWDYQACSEVVIPDCTDGKTDMFYNRPWNKTEYAANCLKNFGVRTDFDAALREYGGSNLKYHSNIIFSNGQLDPWSGGGVLTTPSPAITVILIEDSAHHLDLRASNPKDPQSVVAARAQEVAIIKRWIKSAKTVENDLDDAW